ncbi:MAG TPA: hypothetical protein PKH39_19690 [Woeseiaceae bacterium]|nr:hypothetical protein [Woeseiaceae bacterium]
MNHRVGRTVFALVVGLLVAVNSYRWITDPQGRAARMLEIEVVEASRARLREIIGVEPLDIVDTLAPNRIVGKAYVYPEGDGWSVSGYYRRNDGDRWHPYLMKLSQDFTLVTLKVQDTDPGLARRAESDTVLKVVTSND